jgi:hypothetical protein
MDDKLAGILLTLIVIAGILIGILIEVARIAGKI